MMGWTSASGPVDGGGKAHCSRIYKYRWEDFSATHEVTDCPGTGADCFGALEGHPMGIWSETQVETQFGIQTSTEDEMVDGRMLGEKLGEF